MSIDVRSVMESLKGFGNRDVELSPDDVVKLCAVMLYLRSKNVEMTNIASPWVLGLMQSESQGLLKVAEVLMGTNAETLRAGIMEYLRLNPVQ